MYHTGYYTGSPAAKLIDICLVAIQLLCTIVNVPTIALTTSLCVLSYKLQTEYRTFTEHKLVGKHLNPIKPKYDEPKTKLPNLE